MRASDSHTPGPALKSAAKMGMPIPMSSDIVDSSALTPPSVYAKPVPSARRVVSHASEMLSSTSSSLADTTANTTYQLTLSKLRCAIVSNRTDGSPIVATYAPRPSSVLRGSKPNRMAEKPATCLRAHAEREKK